MFVFLTTTPFVFAFGCYFTLEVDADSAVSWPEAVWLALFGFCGTIVFEVFVF